MLSTVEGRRVGTDRLVLESVGRANAQALRAIRQVVPAPIQEVAKLVYQAPSELAEGLSRDVADELASLLGGLGFRVSVAAENAPFAAGSAQLEVALVVKDVARLAQLVAEAAAFLGTDLVTARRMVCRSPAVLLSGVSEATVAAMRERFEPLGAEVDVARLDTARHYAVLGLDGKALRRGVLDVVSEVAPGATCAESDVGFTVAELTLAEAQTLWERMHRLGVRMSVCNRDLERYDVTLVSVADAAAISAPLRELGIPERVIPRLLQSLPVVVGQNLQHQAMLALLEQLTAAGGEAKGSPYSFQRFGLLLHEVRDVDAAIELGRDDEEVPPLEAETAAKTAQGARVGCLSRTTALWLQHALRAQHANVGVELL